MILDAIRLTSSNETAILTLPLVWTGNANPYILKSAEGLDVADINKYSYGTGLLGDTFYTVSSDDREITLNIEVIPEVSSLTPQQIRDKIYKEVSKTRNSSIYFDLMFESEVVARIEGHISRIDVSLFSPTTDFSINIKCTGYLFESPSYVSHVELLPAFNGGDMVIPMPEGNAPVGFRTTIDVVNPIAFFGLVELDEFEAPSSQFLITYNFLAGDTIHLSTEEGALELYVRRFSNTLGTWSNIHLADRISIGSIWPILFPRTNYVSVVGSVGTYQFTSFVYRPKYWGL